jgi:hypothetical protein
MVTDLPYLSRQQASRSFRKHLHESENTGKASHIFAAKKRVVWAKLAAMAEGARLATRQFWGG